MRKLQLPFAPTGTSWLTQLTRLTLPVSFALSVPYEARAQSPRPVRALGPVERVSTDSLASVAAAVQMPDRRVLVNDLTARRLLLFDSTLSHGTVIADTTSATANAYGGSLGTLIAFHRDSALFIDPSSLSMFVIGPSGKTTRVMAMPRPNSSPGLIGGPFGLPAVDPRGRIVYFSGELPGSIQILKRGARLILKAGHSDAGFTERVDSAFLERVDLATRAVDTVASIKTPRIERTVKTDAEGVIQSLVTTPDPLPLVDDWAMLPDGTIAVVRGRDYHIDWIAPGGTRSSTPKMPFDWRRLDDANKQTLIDSAVTAQESRFADILAGVGRGGGRGGGGGRAGGGGIGGGRAGGASDRGGGPQDMVPNLVGHPALSDVPDYWPPFSRGAVHADAAGNLWIRTTTLVNGQPVYDVVSRRGEIIDRVQLPAFRAIAGFGPGVIYLAVKDGAGAVHLERAAVPKH